MYHHRIAWADEAERFILFPYRRDNGQLAGLSVTIKTSLWRDFLKAGMSWKSEILSLLEKNEGEYFWKISSHPQPGSRFGFRKGIEIKQSNDEWTTLNILFQKEVRRGLAMALNLHWLLDFLFDCPDEPLSEGAVPQLFTVGTSVSVNHQQMHGCALWVNVSPQGAKLLETIPPQTDYPEARRLIARTWHYYGLRSTRPDWMQAYVREKGILQISAGGNCNCLGTNPDERDVPFGYSMFSHNTDYPQHQITLLMGLAQIWKELREKLPDADRVLI